MDFDSIFTAYYSQFRADSDIPTSTDDEYTVGMRLANEAVNRWANYDDTYWKELFTTAQTEQDGELTIVTGQTAYIAPDNFQEAGGFVKILDSNGNVSITYQIIEPQEVQFKAQDGSYAYFTGNPVEGYTLNLGSEPTSSINGFSIDYVYYKKPSLFTTGTDISEMSQPYFVVHRMLGNQFRASRNPYYASALRDAEDVLKTMQLDNNSGTWSNPWSIADNSGTVFGA